MMRSVFRRLAVIIMALLLALPAAGCSRDDFRQAIRDRGALRVGIKVDVPNFGYLNPSTGQYEGLEIDLARAIAQEILGDESKVQFTAVTAQTRGPMLDNGEIDLVLATFTITEERKLSFNFTQPYYHDEIGFLVIKDSGLSTLAHMSGKTIGVAQSSTTRAALEAEAQSSGITMAYHEFASYPELKAALLAGDIDAISVDKSILSGYKDDGTVILDVGFNPQDYGIATNLENTQLAAFLDEFVGKLKQDGRLDAILARWGQ